MEEHGLDGQGDKITRTVREDKIKSFGFFFLIRKSNYLLYALTYNILCFFSLKLLLCLVDRYVKFTVSRKYLFWSHLDYFSFKECIQRDMQWIKIVIQPFSDM